MSIPTIKGESLKYSSKVVQSHISIHSARYVYWGEYPASFAACLGQEDCYRLILAKGHDPNAQDSNGNTVLHMLVIHDKKVSG
jgi:ankyrin repeat protein